MKVRNAVAVTGIAVLGMVGVYGTSSAATTQPDKAPTTQACAVTSGPTHTGSAPAGLAATSVPVTAATPATAGPVKGAPLVTKEIHLVPAQKISGSCVPIVGQVPTLTLVPAQAVPAAPAQVTAPAKK
jgi:hypothetical protein